MSDVLFDFPEESIGFRPAFQAIGKNRIREKLTVSSVCMNGVFPVGIIYPDIDGFFGSSALIHKASAVCKDLPVFTVAENI